MGKSQMMQRFPDREGACAGPGRKKFSLPVLFFAEEIR